MNYCKFVCNIYWDYLSITIKLFTRDTVNSYYIAEYSIEYSQIKLAIWSKLS